MSWNGGASIRIAVAVETFLFTSIKLPTHLRFSNSFSCEMRCFARKVRHAARSDFAIYHRVLFSSAPRLCLDVIISVFSWAENKIALLKTRKPFVYLFPSFPGNSKGIFCVYLCIIVPQGIALMAFVARGLQSVSCSG